LLSVFEPYWRIDVDTFAIPDWLKPYLPLIGTTVRGVVYFGSAFGFAWAQAVTGSQTEMIANAIVFLIAFGWSIQQKFAAIRARRAVEVAAAQASALATMATGRVTPVTLKVTPAGFANEAVPVPAAEIAAAPAMPTFPAGSKTTAELNAASAGR
jgi:hypothetical protein